jgi:uncharacterized membrane protein
MDEDAFEDSIFNGSVRASTYACISNSMHRRRDDVRDADSEQSANERARRVCTNVVGTSMPTTATTLPLTVIAFAIDTI